LRKKLRGGRYLRRGVREFASRGVHLRDRRRQFGQRVIHARLQGAKVALIVGVDALAEIALFNRRHDPLDRVDRVDHCVHRAVEAFDDVAIFALVPGRIDARLQPALRRCGRQRAGIADHRVHRLLDHHHGTKHGPGFIAPGGVELEVEVACRHAAGHVDDRIERTRNRTRDRPTHGRQ
jgi:hypothetical protein